MNRMHTYRSLDLTTIELDVLKIDLAELSTRRRFLIGTSGLLGVAALTGCGQGRPEPAQVDGPTRTVEHALGTTEVPETPQRVIACDYYFTLPTAVQLEIPVVGVPFGAAQALPDWVAAIAPEDVTDIGTNVAPNLERMSSLQPDLIIGFEFFLESIYNEVAAIAPTVALPREMLNGGWKNGVRKLAEAFG
ncbi:MAG: ABC transporter substrate-binding protein, partial [Chloroflexota bacterium]